MPDVYRNFQELQKRELEGRDWERTYLDRGSRILVMAPHGGGIEPFTAELACEIAGKTFSVYTFRGLKPSRNRALHLTSHRFDEPLAQRALWQADAALAIHGEKSLHDSFVMVGGLWTDLKEELTLRLAKEGFGVLEPRRGLAGRRKENVCNRGRSGWGGQLEISAGLRRRLSEEEALRGRFVAAVRTALLKLERELGGIPSRLTDADGNL